MLEQDMLVQIALVEEPEHGRHASQGGTGLGHGHRTPPLRPIDLMNPKYLR